MSLLCVSPLMTFMHTRINATHAQCAAYDIRSLSGIMQSMVTAPSSPYGSLSVGLHSREAYLITSDCQITHNNKCAEMLAVVRRGPFARPTSEERIEYLLTRVHKSSCGVAFAQHALEHTLSFSDWLTVERYEIKIRDLKLRSEI